MAWAQPGLGKTLNSKLNSEAKQESNDVPSLTALASGQENLAIISPESLAEGQGFDGKDSEASGQKSDLTPEAHQNLGDAPDNKANNQLLSQQEGGGFLDWFRSQFSGFLNRVRTTDSGLSTSAGARHKVGLHTDANPDRANKVRSEATTSIGQQRDQTTRRFRSHPGQTNIMARAVNDEKKPQVKSDELLQPAVSGCVVEAQKKIADAATTKEDNKRKEISYAESQTAKLNRQADDDERRIMLENRGKVAEQQRQGIRDANSAVLDFNTRAAGQHTTLRSHPVICRDA